jgi:hypothetical protein
MTSPGLQFQNGLKLPIALYADKGYYQHIFWMSNMGSWSGLAVRSDASHHPPEPRLVSFLEGAVAELHGKLVPRLFAIVERRVAYFNDSCIIDLCEKLKPSPACPRLPMSNASPSSVFS